METQHNKIVALLKAIIAKKLDCDPNAIDKRSAFFNLGVSSLISEEIRVALIDYFSDLSETLMFEYPNIERLSAHLEGKLVKEIDDSVIEGVSIPEDKANTQVTIVSSSEEAAENSAGEIGRADGDGGYDIAVIGISGRFPQANNPRELWLNLLNNKDCVVEIPKHRWDYMQRFSTDKRDRQALFSKWGGFIDGVEEFDPLFFQISQREAESLDPQQKLFLQCCWELMEDAGYGNPDNRSTDEVGVYVGVTWNEFSVLAYEKGTNDSLYRGAASLYWGIPNRVSYFLDLKGPSIAIDTACSSSLVAIHDACHSLLSGECEMAIAGGVNLNLHPAKYLYLSQNHFLSSDGKCRSFGAGGNGYVPGEGVAAILLKPLDKARRDGDYIYGVIRGSAINHGGKVTGYTVPNPNAHKELVVNAIKQAKTSPEHISYIECHGTGTELGDPIEIRGLSSAFESATDKKQFCAIGSIKSNIGHLEAAAGVAGVIKVLQGMQHRTIPGSLHSKRENKKLNLPSTAFYIAKSNLDWQPANQCDRLIAGISSFGAGGSNAHLIIEDYPVAEDFQTDGSQRIVALSAQTPEQLEQYTDKLIQFITSIANELTSHRTYSISNIAHTLMHGRKHFDCRLAVVADSYATLSKKLQQYRQDETAIEGVFAGIAQTAELPVVVDVENTAEWAERWVKGKIAPKTARGQRVPLPTYPFLKERSWISSRMPLAGNKVESNFETSTGLHPLVDVNSSTLKQQKYSKTLHVSEYVLQDHLVNDIHVIPGVCHLEIAAVTGELAAERTVASIRDVWFSNVISVEDQRGVEIRFIPKGDVVHYEIKDSAQDILFSRGKIDYANPNQAKATPPAPIDIANVRASLAESWSKEEVYKLFVRTGITQKTSFQVMTEIALDHRQCLSRLTLPKDLRADFSRYKLHPALMDGAVQTAMMYVQFLSDAELHILPFHFGEVKQYAPLMESVYVHCLPIDRANKQFDIRICSGSGETLVGISDFILKDMKRGHAVGETSQIERGENYDSYYSPDWKRRDLSQLVASVDNLLLIGDNPALVEALRAQAVLEQSRVIQVVDGDSYREDSVDRFVVPANSLDDYQNLIKKLKKEKRLPERIAVLDTFADPAYDLSPDVVESRLDGSVKNLFVLFKSLIPAAKRGAIVYLCTTESNRYDPVAQALSGLFKTLSVEKPSLVGKVVHVAGACSDTELAAIVANELCANDSETDVSYREQQRYVRTFKKAPTESFTVNDNVLRHEGCYLITGGLGAIGLIVARYLCQQYQAKVYLTGRSQLTPEKRQILDETSANGSIKYLTCDVSVYDEVEYLIRAITDDGTDLRGVIHSAGIIDDAFILKKTPESFAKVLKPKVNGTLNLDFATRDLNLDFFVTFSSVTSILGNFGQSDYGYGNAFEDYYAYYRRQLVECDKRTGKSLSINWPYWKDGGMQLNVKEEEMLSKTFGFKPLSSEHGVQALIAGLQSEMTQFAVLPAGNVNKIERVLGITSQTSTASTITVADAQQSEAVTGDNEPGKDVGRQIEAYLKELFAREIKVPLERIDLTTSFDHYGVDSIMMIDLITVMEEKFSSLPKTLFFEHHTLTELVHYFEEHYASHFNDQPTQSTETAQAELPRQDKAPDEKVFVSRFDTSVRHDETSHKLTGSVYRDSVPIKTVRNDDEIAIIGLSGRYPQAKNLEEFWLNLKEGRDCVTEIPAERWDLTQSYQPGKPVQGKSYGKWGGFLQDADKFDPLFFNISPSEAETMDPQERLFLETVAATIEDAGYTADTLADARNDAENPIGVFAGVMWGDYQLFGVESEDPARWVTPRSFYWAIANRVSYVFNFSGPSIAIDTACSSSLTAIHLACDSISKGECKVAIAGGVNLSLHPNKYNLLSNMQFLSSDGRCRSFGEGGDGYVPGEGVGAVLLKPLRQAIADGDHIYAVIKGSSVNHGGKTSGFTVPNPKRQAQLIADALQVSGVNPRNISYLEAHGTGTSLGDPIEMIGLNKSFAQDDRQYCAIGSLKSNIGHLEAAAGIAGLTKVLFQMKHRTLVPSLHAIEINKSIDFSSSPFYVQQDLQDWNRPLFLDERNNEIEIPRLAGVSSFGAGGSNAHLIIEEYIDPTAPAVDKSVSKTPSLILLSAKKEESLKDAARSLKAFCESSLELDLQDMAYTLQVGRVHMDYRLVVQCSDKAELSAKLDAYLHGKPEIDGLFTGNRTANVALTQLLINDTDSKEVIDKWIQKKNYTSLASLWVSGVAIDWIELHRSAARKRISLPTYPFKGERYWIEKPSSTRSRTSLHPLLDSNVSNLEKIAFSKSVSTADFYVRDHRLNNANVMPASAYMEMAVQAGALACNGKVSVLKNVLWTKPLVVKDEPETVTINLYPDADSVYFEVVQIGDTRKGTYCQGRLEAVETRDYVDHRAIDIEGLKKKLKLLGSEQIENLFSTMGFQFGSSFQVFNQLYCGEREAVAAIETPTSSVPSAEAFVLHPALMDGVLRTTIGIAPDSYAEKMPLPVALARLEIYQTVNNACYVHASLSDENSRHSQIRHFNVSVIDDKGVVLARLQNFMTRLVENAPAVSVDRAAPTLHAPKIDNTRLYESIESYLKRIVSDTLKLSADQIESNRPLDEYGIDSTMIVSLNDILEQRFGPLSKTLFFEYQDLKSLAGYFVEEHAGVIAQALDVDDLQQPRQEVAVAAVRESMQSMYDEIGFAPTDPANLISTSNVNPSTDDIAIVGISGRYPKARNLDEYYENLRAGKNCVTEVPPDRWDIDTYYDPDRKRLGKSYSKWGGFLDDIDQFDPLFFNITPAEVVTIDPQERLFLETVWDTLENAGYTKASLSDSTVGVFAGAMWGQYELLGLREGGGINQKLPGSNFSSIANRASYYFNFRGPSLTLDTMCSSSLTAIHFAYESIKRGECDVAIAGGVNLNVHPHKYLQLSGFQFLSTDGACRSFGVGGDGYVPGEGVGAVMLKPLRQAEADGDFIYGLIKGTGVNHGGKGSGFYVPNPNAQGELIENVLSRNHIRPDQLSYIEAHGTGTALGDPIEVAGLKKALSNGHNGERFCSVGSVKSNIGHLESAAGIAGVTKILLQMNHRELFPSLHSTELNPNLDLTDAPFYVQQTLQQWNKNRVNGSSTRMAGINSFGAGGSNAFIVISEYDKSTASSHDSNQPQLIPISANTQMALKQYAQRLSDFIAKKSDQSLNYGVPLRLFDLAFTLQSSREEMPERLAIVAASLEELRTKLEQYVQGGIDAAGIYSGSIEPTETDIDEAVINGIDMRDIDALAKAWVGGASIDYSRFPRQFKPKKIPLPNYCFQRKSYWFTQGEKAAAVSNIAPRHVAALIDGIEASTESESVFKKRLHATDPIVSSHRFQNRPLFPGVAYLEMLAEALQSKRRTVPIMLRNISWQAPLFVGESGTDVFLNLRNRGDEASYEIWTPKNREKVVHGKGTLIAAGIDRSKTQDQVIDITSFDRPDLNAIDQQSFYRLFDKLDVSYSNEFRCVQNVRYGIDHAVARYALLNPRRGAQSFLYHPALLDSALQTFLMLPSINDTNDMILPFAIDEVELVNPLKDQGYALVSVSSDNRYEATIVDDKGLVCVRFGGVRFRKIKRPAMTSVNLADTSANAELDGNPLHAQVETCVVDLFSRFLDIDVEDLKPNVTFDQYGLESVMAVNITTELEKNFGPQPATLLFEYQTINSLCQYLSEHHQQAYAEKFTLFGDRDDQRAAASDVQSVSEEKTDASGDSASVQDMLEGYIKDVFSQFLEIDVADLKSKVTFEHYGLESVMALNITGHLEQEFGSLPSILLFEYQTIEQLAGYFMEQYPGICQSLLSDSVQTTPVQISQSAYDISYSDTAGQEVAEKTDEYGTARFGYDNIDDVRGAVEALSDEEVDSLLGRLTESA